MCGHVGLATKYTNGGFQNDVDAFENMLFINQLRGMDGTGIIHVMKDGDVSVFKDAQNFTDIQTYEYAGKKDVEDIGRAFVKSGRILMGHNRKATIGSINEQSSHPFIVKDGGRERWYFMHNGTLRNHKKLGDFEIDSEALANHLCIAKDIPDLEARLAQVDGAYACQWYDQKKEKLYLVRNLERPLWIAETNNGVMWASELAFMYAAANRNRIKIEKHYEVKTNTLYILDMNNITKGFQEVALSVKKPIPTPTTNGKVGGGVPGTKQIKKLRGKWIGQFVSFWLDDYIDRDVNAPMTKPSGDWLCWGENPTTFDCNHQIIGFCQNQTEQLMKERENGMWSGVVYAVDLDEKTNMLTIRVRDIKPLIYSPKAVH